MNREMKPEMNLKAEGRVQDSELRIRAHDILHPEFCTLPSAFSVSE